MKLFILHDIPYPDFYGGRKLSLGRILESKKVQDTSVLAFNYNGVNTVKVEKFFKRHNIGFYCYQPTLVYSKILKHCLSFFNLSPVYLKYFQIHDFDRTIFQIIDELKPDCISLESIFLVEKIKNIPVGIETEVVLHNVESKFFKELAKTETKRFRKLFLLIESMKIRRLEFSLSRTISGAKSLYAVCLTEKDSNVYQKIFKFPKEKIRINNNAIYLPYKIIRKVNHDQPFFLFPGGLMFPPNREGLFWFLEAYEKYSKLSIPVVVTGKIDPSLRNINSYIKVIYSGYLCREKLYKLYATTQCVISPILSGGGIKIKNIEAISLGVPILMTKFSAEGLESHLDYFVRINHAHDAMEFCSELFKFYCDLNKDL